MMYNVDGTEINTAYDVDGQNLAQVYDIDSNPLINNIPIDLVVMSYNIGQWYTGIGSNVPTAKYDEYYALQRSIISSNEPDIVAFQEYWEPFSSGHSVDSVIGEYFTDEYTYTSGGTYVKKAIYTNEYTLSNGQTITFDAGTECYQKCSIQVGERTVWLINAHLATSSNESRKVAEAAELLDIVEDLNYFILFGDFNTVCKSINDAEYTTIMKQFIDAGYHSANCSEQYGFIDTWFGSDGSQYPCDHIITSANIDINNVVADQTKVTDDIADTIDHIPLIAYVTVN